MKAIRIILTLAIFGFISHFAIGQGNSVKADHESLKKKGLIPIPAQVSPAEPVHTIKATENSTRDGGLFVPLDDSFTQVYFYHDYAVGEGYYNDDGSTDAIQLPFDFCLYGVTKNEFFINNNGNVSFDGYYSTFTSTGFPIDGYPMLAPFWADVDTRQDNGPLGEVWYKVTPTSVIVIWNNVGYYDEHGDKRNTFELIFTDGNDPLIGVGNNVAFSFADMAWTTGDASDGVNGFGGVPATVGVNKGDGVKYALVGRFDHAGYDYDGAGGNNDGVNYLTGKYYTFNACSEDVIIPGAVPISGWALFIGIGLILLFAIIRYRKML